MTDSHEPDDKSGLYAVALVSQLGLVIAAPIVVGALGGMMMERRYAAGGFFLVGGILLGVAAGIVAAWRLLKPFLE